MRYGSVCSGIEAATVAWHPLGWTPVFYAEIEPFPSAVIAARWPGVPNLGDFTRIGRDVPCDPIDLLVGGTPCQSFSVAGLRGGLSDERGNLALEFLRLADRLRPRWVVWENVPGVLSSVSHDAPDPYPPPPPVDVERDGAEVETEDDYDAEELHAFGCFVAGLSELGYGWSFWVPDAQYFRLAQRRRRVFVVGHLGAWAPAAAVLLEPSCLSGNPPPSRAKGQGVAGSLAPGAHPGGLTGQDADRGNLVTANPLGAKRDGGWRGDLDNDTFVAAFGGNNEAGAVDVATAVNGHGGPRLDFKSETFLLHGYSSNAMAGDGDAAAAIPSDLARCLDTTGGFAPNQGGTVVAEPFTLAIRGRGDDSDLEVRQDGTANALLTPNGGRGGINVGAVAYGLRSDAGRPGEALTPSPDAEGKIRLRDPGFNVYEEHAPTLDGGAAHAVAFGWAKSAAQTLTTDAETTDALQACPTSNPAIQSAMTVRRLTPRECERLQGFPDDYTLIDFKGKPAADGSRYRAIGNSFPVPVVRWIGRRIEMVDRIAGPLFAAAEEGTR